jgi:hypothetical protein
MLLSGVVIFLIGSIIPLIVPSYDALMLSRIITGFAGGIIMPQSRSSPLMEDDTNSCVSAQSSRWRWAGMHALVASNLAHVRPNTVLLVNPPAVRIDRVESGI